MWKFRKCFECRWWLPLFMYNRLKKGDYTVKAHGDWLIVCKTCTTRRFIRQGYGWHRENRKWIKYTDFKQYLRLIWRF